MINKICTIFTCDVAFPMNRDPINRLLQFSFKSVYLSQYCNYIYFVCLLHFVLMHLELEMIAI